MKGWLAAARREKKEQEARIKDGGNREGDKETQTEAEGHWGRVVEIVQTAFREGEMAEEATWRAVVLIPKGKGDYRGIGRGFTEIGYVPDSRVIFKSFR